MQEKFLEKNFQLIEKLKENVSLMYDKINRRLCIVKKIRNSEMYSRLKKIENPHTPKFFSSLKILLLKNLSKAKIYLKYWSVKKNYQKKKLKIGLFSFANV